MQINVGTPWIRYMRQGQNTVQIRKHSISWGCPHNCPFSPPPIPHPVSLLISTFGIHLEPGCKSHGQTIHFHAAKSAQNQATSFLSF